MFVDVQRFDLALLVLEPELWEDRGGQGAVEPHGRAGRPPLEATGLKLNEPLSAIDASRDRVAEKECCRRC